MTDSSEPPQVVDLAALLDVDLDAAVEHWVEIPGRGRMRFRPMSRAEAVHVTNVMQDPSKGIAEWERQAIATTSVEPKLSHADVKRWQDRAGSAGEIQIVSEFITAISGLGERDVGKEAATRFPG